MSVDVEMFAGDAITVHIDVTDEDGAEVDLTGADITWMLAPWAGGTAILTKTDADDITIAVPDGRAASSQIVVTIDAGEVTEPSDYYHVATVTLSGIKDTVRSGTFRVKPTPL